MGKISVEFKYELKKYIGKDVSVSYDTDLMSEGKLMGIFDNMIKLKDRSGAESFVNIDRMFCIDIGMKK